jgi:hypothetical protein
VTLLWLDRIPISAGKGIAETVILRVHQRIVAAEPQDISGHVIPGVHDLLRRQFQLRNLGRVIRNLEEDVATGTIHGVVEGIVQPRGGPACDSRTNFGKSRTNRQRFRSSFSTWRVIRYKSLYTRSEIFRSS